MKRNCLVQERIRRLRNTSRRIGWNVKAGIISEFSNKMRVSGYSPRYRLEIIQAAVKGFDEQCRKADSGITPLHRSREFQEEHRWKKKLLSRYTWYRPANTVLFVPGTPAGTLAKTIQTIVKEETARMGMSARVIETGGVSLKRKLVSMDLTGCFYTDCYLCEGGLKGGSHTKSGVVYSGTCTLCSDRGVTARYEGETGRNGYWRSTVFHRKEIMKNDTGNAFTKHLNIHHKDRVRDPSVFKLKVESSHKSCLDRQVKEGISIKNTKSDIKLNSKSEYHQPAVRRVTVL